MTTARRPRTTPSASISTQSFFTSDGLIEGVVLSMEIISVSGGSEAAPYGRGSLDGQGLCRFRAAEEAAGQVKPCGTRRLPAGKIPRRAGRLHGENSIEAVPGRAGPNDG